MGTTSACAENTQKPGGKKFLDRNYLRVRGEYPRRMLIARRGAELPPRARRIPDLITELLPPIGTTSACAENTLVGGVKSTHCRNYLRVRGEYWRHPARFHR